MNGKAYRLWTTDPQDDIEGMSLENAENWNLDIVFTSPILLFASKRAAGPRHRCMAKVDTGKLTDCLELFKQADKATLFIDKYGNLKCKTTADAKVEYFTFRVWRDGVSVPRQEKFMEKAKDMVTTTNLTIFTSTLGPQIAMANHVKTM